MTNHKGLYICKLKSKHDGVEREFQGSSAALQGFEKMAAREGWITVFHRRMST